MGFGRRLVRKTVRKATPRPVRRAMHPVRTVKYAATPRPVRQVSRAVYTVTNPLGAAENKLIGAALSSGSRRRASPTRGGPSTRSRSAPTSQGMSGTGVRAAEAVASHDQLAQLMIVQRERFTAARRPLVPDPSAVDPKPFQQQEWERRKGEAHLWQRARRQQLRAETAAFGKAAAADLQTQAHVEQREQQALADTWWTALNQGEPGVLIAALEAAFDDNPAPVVVVSARGSDAFLALVLPGPEVLPPKTAHITPTGRLSSRAWTKTELNQVYTELLGAHLLATIRETWAVAPSLTNLRVAGLRKRADGPRDVLFDVYVSRADGHWADDRWGDTLLAHVPGGLNRAGRAQEVQPWPREKLRPRAADLLANA